MTKIGRMSAPDARVITIEAQKGVCLFCAARARPPIPQMIAFIKDHQSGHVVEPICRVLQIASSTFYEHLAIERDPDRASDLPKRDAYLRKEMLKVWLNNRSVYGARKLWHAMKREGCDIARYTVERSSLGTLLRNVLPGSGCARLALKVFGEER